MPQPVQVPFYTPRLPIASPSPQVIRYGSESKMEATNYPEAQAKINMARDALAQRAQEFQGNLAARASEQADRTAYQDRSLSIQEEIAMLMSEYRNKALGVQERQGDERIGQEGQRIAAQADQFGLGLGQRKTEFDATQDYREAGLDQNQNQFVDSQALARERIAQGADEFTQAQNLRERGQTAQENQHGTEFGLKEAILAENIRQADQRNTLGEGGLRVNERRNQLIGQGQVDQSNYQNAIIDINRQRENTAELRAATQGLNMSMENALTLRGHLIKTRESALLWKSKDPEVYDAIMESVKQMEITLGDRSPSLPQDVDAITGAAPVVGKKGSRRDGGLVPDAGKIPGRGPVSITDKNKQRADIELKFERLYGMVGQERMGNLGPLTKEEVDAQREAALQRIGVR